MLVSDTKGDSSVAELEHLIDGLDRTNKTIEFYERMLGIAPTTKPTYNLNLRGDWGDRLYINTQQTFLEGESTKKLKKYLELETDIKDVLSGWGFNLQILKIDDQSLELRVQMPETISIFNLEEEPPSNETCYVALSLIKNIINKAYKLFKSTTIELDFRDTNYVKKAFAEQLMDLRLKLAKTHGVYHNMDIEILKHKHSKTGLKLRKAEKEIISAEINRNRDLSKKELKALPKAKVDKIMGPDLRLHPFSEYGVIPIEVYDKDSKCHKHKGYAREVN